MNYVENTEKVVKNHKYNSQDFAQTQENFAQSHDRETVTFRNSEMHLHRGEQIVNHKLKTFSKEIGNK